MESIKSSTLNQAQAAEILGVNVVTLWRWVKAGIVPTIQVGGRKRYKMSDLQSIIEHGTLQG